MKHVNFYYLLFLLGALLVSCSGADQVDDDAINNGNNGNDSPNIKDEKIDIPFDFRGIDNRRHITPGSYTTQEKEELNIAFLQYVNKAKTTRGKVVSAGLFLVNLEYCVPYSFEVSGRAGYELVARYTRKGLFLNSITENGFIYPAWGEEVTRIPGTHPNVKNLGNTYPNGLHCSTFVSWCLFNAGVASAELLNGYYANRYRNFPNSEAVPLSTGHRTIRPGDLLWFEGHISIVLGVEGDYVIYGSGEGGSDAAWAGSGVRWKVFNRATTNYNTFQYKELIKMEGIY